VLAAGQASQRLRETTELELRRREARIEDREAELAVQPPAPLSPDALNPHDNRNHAAGAGTTARRAFEVSPGLGRT